MPPHLHTPETPIAVPLISVATTGPRWNALKHGRYAKPGLLPGEDPAQFARERRALFHNYRPQTKDEADLVAAMARCGWALERYDGLQEALDEQALAPEHDAAGRVTEPIAHQRLHSSMDVTVHRQRVSRIWHRARAELRLAQQQRRQGLVQGAVKLPEGCYMEVDGTVYGPVVPPPIAPVPEPDLQPDNGPATGSEDGRIGKNKEQQETGGSAANGGATGGSLGPTTPPEGAPNLPGGFPGYVPESGLHDPSTAHSRSSA